MKVYEAEKKVSAMLGFAGIDEPYAKARVIAAHTAGNDPFAELSEEAFDIMLIMAQRAQNGEPVEYLIGKAYFRYLELIVTPDVLIPRKETELVAGKAIELIKQNEYKKALDMCTGSGCIAISLAAETAATVHGCDISEKAAELAKQNAALNGSKAEFFVSDMFESIIGAYDIIVCNPPYVSDEEYLTLCADVKDYEPSLALKAGDGYEFYRIIADEAPKFLKEGGALVLEIGANQAAGVAELLENRGFINIDCSKDYHRRDRIIAALRG